MITDGSGSGRTVLGLFDRDDNGRVAASVQVDNLPPHVRICIEFDLVLFGGWEAAQDPFNRTGPEDLVWLTLDNANVGGTESPAEVFRGTYDNDDFPDSDFEVAGADTDEALVVPIKQCIDHVADDAQFDFHGFNTARQNDESWAIESLKITTP